MSNNIFGDRLGRIIIDQQMTQSELARRIWGETGVDNRGYEFPIGKDRISSYISGRQLPSPRNYRRLLEVLNLTPEELPVPNKAARPRIATPNVKIEALEKEIARLTEERDYWKDSSQKMADLALTLAKVNKERDNGL